MKLQSVRIEQFIQSEEFKVADGLCPAYLQTLEKYRSERDFSNMELSFIFSKAKIKVGLDLFKEGLKICNSYLKRNHSEDLKEFKVFRNYIRCLKKLNVKIEDQSMSGEKKCDIWDKIGDIYDSFAFKRKAIKAYDRALEKCNDEEKKSNIYFTLGWLHEELKNYPLSYQNYKKSLDCSDESEDLKLCCAGALRANMYLKTTLNSTILKISARHIKATLIKKLDNYLIDKQERYDIIEELEDADYKPTPELPELSTSDEESDEDTAQPVATKSRRNVTKVAINNTSYLFYKMSYKIIDYFRQINMGKLHFNY